jgi:hypothetical protein
MVRGMAYEVCTNNAHAANNYEDEVKPPSDIRERRTRSLQVHKIRERDSRHTQTNALGSNMIREQLRVKHHARDIHAHAIYREEEIEHGDSSAQRGFICGSLGIRGDDGGFDDQADAAATDAEEHQRFAPNAVHEEGADGVEDDADCDPAALEFELLFAVTPPINI